jgi:hypothetical protein
VEGVAEQSNPSSVPRRNALRRLDSLVFHCCLDHDRNDWVRKVFLVADALIGCRRVFCWKILVD